MNKPDRAVAPAGKISIAGQGYFLRALGLMDYLRTSEENAEAGSRCHEKAIAIHSLLNGIGTKLKVFIQRKGPVAKELTGLALARTFV
ncbi:hypothetical protein [Chitinophaga sp.]|uniref:hypothetical protein n=1 Tax=Chitinophaga sp. TaxID=1869181 RepID=UPI0031DF7548